MPPEGMTHELPRNLTPSQRDGVIFMAIIGGLSTLSLLILLVHIISVSFVPLCLSALNLRRAVTPTITSSTGNSQSIDLVSVSGAKDRKSSVAASPGGSSGNNEEFPIELERARAVAERKARARARELSRIKTKNSEERLFLRMQLGIFIVCMLISDLIQTIGVLIQARWAYLGRVESGPACWVQGATLTFGDVATAVWNSVIACHTFTTVVLGLRMSTLAVSIVVIIGWSIPVIVTVIGSVVIATPKADYYDVAGAWCFIANAYKVERVLLHYVPLLIACLIITIMYSLVSLVMRGNLHVTPSGARWGITWYSWNFRRTTINRGSMGNTNQKQVAYLRSLSFKMLWYPCIYICLVLPISICRMVELQGHSAPFELLFFAMTLLFLVGLSNVAIYVTTRNVGVTKKNPVVRSVTAPNTGTQVEIYIDRVTQRDIGITTIGGTNLYGRDKTAIRFEMSELDDMEGKGKGGDESSQHSSDRDIDPNDTKSPNSATQFVHSRSSTFLTEYSVPEEWKGDHLRPLPRTPSRTHTPSRSVGSVMVDRIGATTPSPQDYEAPFQSLVERPQVPPMPRRTPSPINPFARTSSTTHSQQSHPYAFPSSNSNTDRRSSLFWDHHKKSKGSIG